MSPFKRLFSTAMFFIFLSGLNAQDKKMIEEAREWMRGNVDTMRLKGYLNTGLGYIYSDKDSSIFYLKKTEELAKKLNAKRYQANALITMGNVYSIHRSDSLSKKYFFNGIALLDPNKDFLYMAMGHGGLSSMYARDGQYDSAVVHRYQQIKFAEKSKDLTFLAQAYGGLAGDYRAMQNRKKALEYFQKSVAIKEKLPDSTSLCIGYINLATSYYTYLDTVGADYLGITEMTPNPNVYNSNALKYYSKALAIAKKLGQKNLLVAAYQGLTDAHIDRGEYDKATIYLEENKKILAQFKEENMSHLNAYVSYGIVNFVKKDYKMTESYYERARDLAEKFGDTYYIQSIDQKFYILYNTMGEYKKALQYYQKHINETLRQNKVDLQDKVNHLEIKYETAKKEQANAALREQTELQQAQLEKKQMTIYLVASMGLAIFVCMILLVRQNRLKARSQAIELEQRLLRSQMNPHFIFNSLVAIQSFLLKHNPQESSRYLSSFARLMRLILENSREEVVVLDKEIKTNEYYLELQKLRVGEKMDYQIKIDPELETEFVAIPPMLVQPFLENSIEHGILPSGEKGVITIELKKHGNYITLTATDNGVGINSGGEKKDKDHRSMAMQITKERLAIINQKNKNKISIRVTDLSDEGAHGTKVTFEIPLTNI